MRRVRDCEKTRSLSHRYDSGRQDSGLIHGSRGPRRGKASFNAFRIVQTYVYRVGFVAMKANYELQTQPRAPMCVSGFKRRRISWNRFLGVLKIDGEESQTLPR